MDKNDNQIEEITKILKKILEKYDGNMKEPKMEIKINSDGLVHVEGNETDICFGLSILVSTLKYEMDTDEDDIKFAVQFGLKHNIGGN